jgi:pimeloyl-ACP methyl ester carboxylesterase
MWTSQTVPVGPIDLAAFECGPRDGTPVVLVHGWPDTHRLWDSVAPLLAGRCRVIAYDTRGHGESTRPTETRDFRLENYADDFFALIDALEPDRPVHVLAHDWGSVQVWQAAADPRAAGRIASFTSVSGPNLDYLGRLLSERLRHPTPTGLREIAGQLVSSSYAFFFLIPGPPELYFRLTGRPGVWRLFHRITEGTTADSVHIADTLSQDMISGLRIYRANVRRLLRPDDRRVDVPVQLLVARRDVAVRAAPYAYYDRWVPRLHRVDLKSGHWSPFSHPEALAEHTLTFIDSL